MLDDALAQCSPPDHFVRRGIGIYYEGTTSGEKACKRRLSSPYATGHPQYHARSAASGSGGEIDNLLVLETRRGDWHLRRTCTDRAGLFAFE